MMVDGLGDPGIGWSKRLCAAMSGRERLRPREERMRRADRVALARRGRRRPAKSVFSRRDLAYEAPRDEDQRDEEDVESDNGCEKKKDFHDCVWCRSSGSLMAEVPSTCAFYPQLEDRLRLRFESDR